MPPPSTAADLLAAVRPFGPAAEGDELVFAIDPPPELIPRLAVLHTGVRALLTGRRWVATVEGGKAGRFTRVSVPVLDPNAPLPAGVTLLCVEGDRKWDRLDPAARLDLPDLFAG
jgi:hypothetical protein